MGKRTLLGVGLAHALSPSSARACAVCFGRSDQVGLMRGLTWGLVVLLGFTFFILGSIALAVLRIEKARAASERLASSGALS